MREWFCLIINISVYKLENAARICKGEKPIDTPHLDEHSKDPQSRILVEVFLQHIHDKWSIPKEENIGDDKYVFRLIFGFYDRENLFDWFSLHNDGKPVSYDWFRKVWDKKFPNLKCMKDRACPTCNFYLGKMKENECSNHKLFNDMKLCFEDHIKDAKEIREYVETQIQSAKLRITEQRSLVMIMDHFGTHFIPASKQSLSEFKSLEGHGVLGVSFSGVCNPVNGTNNYIIYNEPFSENSNINCFHFDKYFSSWIKNHAINELIIVSDTCAKIRYFISLILFLQN